MTDDYRAGVRAALRAVAEEKRRTADAPYPAIQKVGRIESLEYALEAVELATGVYRDNRGQQQREERCPRKTIRDRVAAIRATAAAVDAIGGETLHKKLAALQAWQRRQR